MRKASDSTKPERLRRDFTKVTKERQAWATKARKLEAENTRWATRFNALLKYLTAIGAAPVVIGETTHTHAFDELLYEESDGSRYRCVCGARLWEPKSTAAVSREIEGKP